MTVGNIGKMIVNNNYVRVLLFKQNEVHGFVEFL